MSNFSPINYPWFNVGNDKLYYLPNSRKAYKKGFFILDDTKQIFMITGIMKNVRPTCFEFEECKDMVIDKDDIPIAFVVPEDFLEH